VFDWSKLESTFMVDCLIIIKYGARFPVKSVLCPVSEKS